MPDQMYDQNLGQPPLHEDEDEGEGTYDHLEEQNK